MKSDRRITIEKLAHIVQISRESVRVILHEHLHMNKVSARWVPRMLTIVQKNDRVVISQELLDSAKGNPDRFFDRLVTMDESWVHHYDPETKEQSKEWRHPESPPPRKFRVQPSAGKVMLSVFWDTRGVLLIDFLDKGRTINGQYYCDLLTKLRAAIKSKRRVKLTKDVLLQHDNASSHTCISARQKISELGFEVLPHPPYSPDLAPSDFYLFGNLKSNLRGTHFESDESLKMAVTQWFESQTEDFYKTGITKLLHRWEKCIALGGDYIEKT